MEQDRRSQQERREVVLLVRRQGSSPPGLSGKEGRQAEERFDLGEEVRLSQAEQAALEGASSDEDSYVEKRAEAEFWLCLLQQVDKWDTGNLKQNEKLVLEAVKVLLHNIDDIEIFNKKAVYLYLRELTGLNTKQVVNNLNKLREKYRIFRTKWNK